ncbi:MAG: ferrous iron transport protein B [Deltaproteobacteria bacterium]|nr:ferrous iron transport protein B [Deltaproteobacteria bacterium]
MASADQLTSFALDVLDVRDPYTRCHADGVGAIAALLAEAMGIEPERVERIRLAGRLHDIGKIGAPAAIVNKASRLTREEYEIVKTHSAIGADLIGALPELADMAPWVRSHHEYPDGRGYPDGLSGEAICLEARILGVADAVDAMTTDRPYRKRMSLAAACEEVERLAGTQFCPQTAAALDRIRPRVAGHLVEHMTHYASLFAQGAESAAAADTASGPSRLLIDAALDEKLRVRYVGGEAAFRRRLLELGVVPGAALRVMRIAPMGDPIEVAIRGASFFLRKEEASQVTVETVAGEVQAARTRSVGVRPASRRYFAAVAGNPNTGKTTLFNVLADARGHVGNYPGVTVERLTGKLEGTEPLEVELVDVPGTYSLNARSRDEQVAMDEVLGRAGSPAPDAVLVVLNATALERSLYLLLQVQELGYPVVAAVNMMDEARRKGMRIDVDALSAAVGAPVVGVSARQNEGIDAVRDTLVDLLQGSLPPQAAAWSWEPSEDLVGHLDELLPAIGDQLGPGAELSRRRAFALWCLMSLSEDDDLAGIPDELRARTLKLQAAMREEGHDLDLEVSQKRYAYIDDVVRQSVQAADEGRPDRSRRIDDLLTHPIWGMGVFLLAMGIVFGAIFDWAAPMMDGIEAGVGAAAGWLRSVLPESWLADLLVDGVVAGVGSVLVFLPQILLLFFFISVMENSGYMARAAFMIDRLMRKLGMNGKAFVPMLSGFACAIPAVMATRTLENRRDRLLTMMVIPLISCSARLPVYVLLIAALFPADQSVLGPINMGMLMMFGLYLLSTLMAFAAAAVLGRTVLKGKPQPLLLELPPYRLPTAKDLLRVMGERSWDFLRTAGTVILIATVVLWGLLNFPRTETYSRDYDAAAATARQAGDADEAGRLADLKRAEELENSMAGRFGKLIEPLIEPLGFDWKIGIGLIGSFAAREVFVSTLGQVYAAGEEADEESATLRAALRSQRRKDGSLVYTPLVGLSLLVFFMLAMQCVSTLAIVRQEAGGWKWAMFQLGYMTGLAYLASLAVYQIGRLIGFS